MARLEDGALALDILDVEVQLLALEAHLRSEGAVWLPLGGGTRGGLGHHLVDLLEGQALGLGNQEESVDESASAQATPDEEDRRLEIALVLVDHVRGDDGNDGVPQPVRGGGEGNTTRADREGEDLADDDPGTRTPRRGEEEDEDGDEGNLGVDGRDVVGDRDWGVGVVEVSLVEADSHTNDGHEELTDQHAKSTPDEERTTTKLLNGVEGDRGGAHVDEGEDQGDQEGVGDGAGRSQEGSRVVEDEVDTGPLLHHLERSTEDGFAQVRVGLPKRAREAVGPAGDPTTSGDDRTLVLLVGNDLSKLGLDVLAITRLATEAGKRLAGFLNATTLHEVTRRVGKEHETTTKDDAPGELNSDRNAVAASVGTVANGVVDAGRNEQTESNAELVAGDERTANLLRANLRHVQNDDGGLETDTETGDDTTSNEESESVRSSLENHTCRSLASIQAIVAWFAEKFTDEVDRAASDDGPLAADHVGDITGDDSTEEGTGRKDRDDERLGGTPERGCVRSLDDLDEHWRASDTVDVPRIITEEDTTERRESADQVGLPGDWRLNAVDIGRRGERGARHGGGCCCCFCCC